MANTTPQTTFSNIPTPSKAETSTCQVIIPDYSVLRKKKYFNN